MDLAPITSTNVLAYSQAEASLARAKADIDSASKNAPSNINASEMARIEEVAENYEAVFLSQMVAHMFQDVGKNSMFHGGQTEEIFKGLLIEEYGKSVASQGGIGLAEHIKAELIRIQEANQ